MKTKRKERFAATITVKRPDQLTKQGAKDIAAWMRRIAKDLVELSPKMAKVFRARYCY